MRSLAAVIFAVTLSALASVARADAPRVALVVEGDPIAAMTTSAERLEGALVASNDVVVPTDALVRSALRGDPGTPEDGLDAVRGLRRRLGWSAEADREALASIGAQLDLVAIVIVRGGEQSIARVYDVGEAHYFVGEAPLDEASIETSTHFVLARVRAAEHRRLAPPPETTATDSTSTATDSTASAAPGATDAAPVPHRRWIRRNWPFIVAGALLVGATTFFVVQRNGNDASSPVIHVRPGGSP